MIPADLLRLPLDSHAGRHEAHFSEAPSQSQIRLACCSRRPGGATAGRPAPDRCSRGLRPFVWAAVYSEPYRPPPGPYPPDSGEWLFVQGIGFCASLVSGAAAAHWSPQGSKLPIGILVGFSFIGLLFTQFPLETSAIRNVIYAVGVPLGIVVGAVIRWRREAKEEHLQ